MKPTRIVLDAETSATLAEAGTCFAVVGRASWPDDPSRFVLHVLPCSVAKATQAVEVATGERRPGRRISPTPKP